MKSVIALTFLAACAQGAPPGFSHGSQWTMPLVDPLADGRLVTPVYLDGKGPFLFAIDPDAPYSMVDREALPPAFPYKYRGRRLDEKDVTRPVADAYVREMQIGDLTISLRDIGVTLDHTFDRDGRRIHGILGRDVIEDSLVFGFDRERGVAWLSTQEAFHAPAGATVLDYHKGTPYTGGAVIRRLVSAKVDGHEYELHLDLGDVSNQLRAEHWQEAQLVPGSHRETVIDEIGTHRDVTVAGTAAHVAVDGVDRGIQQFIPYDDRRWAYGQLEGALGLAFFQPYDVAADWHHERYYLTPRAATTPQDAQLRLGRWGAAIPAACAQTGCVTFEIAHAVEHPPSELGIVPDHPGEDVRPAQPALLTVAKDPAMHGRALEVAFRAPDTYEPLVVHLPADTDSLSVRVEPRYAAGLTVVDVSPFPRDCAGGCVTRN